MIQFKVNNDGSIDFFGHKYHLKEISKRFAYFSNEYSRFIDFEIVNIGFDIKDVYELHKPGQIKGQNYLCYNNAEDVLRFIEKLIVEFRTNHSDWIEVTLPKTMEKKLFGKDYVYTNKQVLFHSGTETDEPQPLIISVRRRHKLNIDFTE